MAYRSATSQANFLASQTDAVVTAAIPNLALYVSSLVGLRPLAVRLVGAAEAGLTVKQVWIQDETVQEKRYLVYQGDHIPLADFMELLAEDAARLGSLTPHKFISDHGLEFEMTYSSTGAKLHTFVWGMQNQANPDPIPGVGVVTGGEPPGGPSDNITDRFSGGNMTLPPGMSLQRRHPVTNELIGVPKHIPNPSFFNRTQGRFLYSPPAVGSGNYILPGRWYLGDIAANYPEAPGVRGF
jgi:hypothetical protein